MDSALLTQPPTAADIGLDAVIDGGRLDARLGEIDQGSGSQPVARQQTLKILRDTLNGGRASIRERFAAGHLAGAGVLRATCHLVDTLLVTLCEHVSTRLYPEPNPSTGEHLALVAVGGYGRGELAPASDIDLLFLLPYKMTPRSEQIVEEVLYFLWDLGFKVGHATRTVDDCIRRAKADLTINTGLLEARYLWGERALFHELRRRYDKEVRAANVTGFIEGKLAERDARHRRIGDSRYQLEPNVKESKGGLRDLSTLFWIAKYVYGVDNVARLVDLGVFSPDEAKRFDKAQQFLWTLRCHLHDLSGRAEERLTFDLQREIAPRMGYVDHAGTRAVERLMKHYYLVAKDVGELTRVVCAQLESDHRRRARFRLPTLRRGPHVAGFPVEGDRLTVNREQAFRDYPIRMLRIFASAQKHGLDIHPRALRWIGRNLKHIDNAVRADPDANRVLLNILTSPNDPETALRRMNEAGVLGRFVPEFGRIVAMMQYNMYHHYTVDEHTIFAVGELHRIERGELAGIAPIATDVIHKVNSRRALYVAILLHDIGKGRPEDHSEVGEQIAHKLGPRLGLSEEETDTVAWLVRHHLDMSNVAFKRDLQEPKTIRDFAGVVRSLERLRLLLCLTVADIRAVGPNTWNDWKAALLRDLYWATEDELAGGVQAADRDTRVERAKRALAERLADWPRPDVDAHLARGYPAYWLGWDVDAHEHHARLMRAADTAGRALTVDTRVDDYRAVAEVTVYTADHPGLFSRIAGALAVAGASINAARIFTTRDGMALDTFWVRDAQGGPFAETDKLNRAARTIEHTLRGEIRPMAELQAQRPNIPSRYDVFSVPPRVFTDNTIAPRHTVIEVDGPDRQGLLYQVTDALFRLNVMIHGAKISTYGERAIDVFYVQSVLGEKITKEATLKRIRQNLTDVLAPPQCPPAATGGDAVRASGDGAEPADGAAPQA
jgi:[protein-PII] uridylyltransferase